MNLPEEKYDELAIMKSIVDGRPEIDCFPQDMAVFYEARI